MNLKRNSYNICAIQEPYIDPNSLSRANHQWFTIYPSTHLTEPSISRLILLINTNLITNNWKHILILHPDITTIALSTPQGIIWIFNIYNNCKNNNTLQHGATFMAANPASRSSLTPIHYIWVGISTTTILYGMSHITLISLPNITLTLHSPCLTCWATSTWRWLPPPFYARFTLIAWVIIPELITFFAVKIF